MTYPEPADRPKKPRRPRRPSPIASFTDCHQLWETALLHGSLEVDFPTKSASIAMRQRMNTYRCLLRDRAALRFAGAEAESPYDHLQIALREQTLVIAMKPTLVGVTIRTQAGTPVLLVPYIPSEGAAPVEQLAFRHTHLALDDDLPE